MIEYRKLHRYKYQLLATYNASTLINYPMVDYASKNGWMYLSDSLLVIKKGYCWDGPSGPTIDTPNFMRGSLVHDALYQLFRENPHIAREHRDTADRLLQSMCIEDGMSKLRAAWVYWGVHTFGAKSAGL